MRTCHRMTLAEIEGLCDCKHMCVSTKKYFLALWIITAANRLPKLATERPLVHKVIFLHMSLSGPLHANPRERGHAPSRYLTTKNVSCYIPCVKERRSTSLVLVLHLETPSTNSSMSRMPPTKFAWDEGSFHEVRNGTCSRFSQCFFIWTPATPSHSHL